MTLLEAGPFVRGAAWPAVGDVAYPRSDPGDARRLPADTWAAAQVPATVRLELVGDASAVTVHYETLTDDVGYRGPAAGTTFTVWRDGFQIDEQPAEHPASAVRLQLGAGGERAIVYLPEGMKPVIVGLDPEGGTVEPAPPQPRWLAYGDSIAEGWVASGPAHSWVAITSRTEGLDVVNMGYAGSARGEIVSAVELATLDADVISLTHGTNCWSMIPFTAQLMRVTTETFLRMVRRGHPGVPIVVGSPLVRPDAETTPNIADATLSDLRQAMEDAVLQVDDPLVTLIPGRDLVPPDLLPDGIHPGDAGHRILADVYGRAIRDALEQREGG